MKNEPEGLDRLEALVAAMTPGPWEARVDEEGMAALAGRGGWVLEGDAVPEADDADGIATLRNIAAELIAVARAVVRWRSCDLGVCVDALDEAVDACDALEAKLKEVLDE